MTMQVARRQAGFSLIEVTIALIIMMALAALGVTIMQDSTRRQESAATGDWLRAIAGAAKAYERSNTSALLASAGPASPAVITAAQLLPLLPRGFNVIGPQGHTFTVRWLEPTAGKLQGLVVLQGGDALPGMSLIQVAGQAGGGAGYVDPINPNQGKGPQGTWTENLTVWGGSPGVGKPLYALFYDTEAETGANDYLNRTAVTGKPELNRMNTAIDMALNNVDNGGRINASDINSTGGVQANQIAIGKAPFGAAGNPYETIQLNNGYNMRLNIGAREHTILQNDGSLVTHGNIGSDNSIVASGNMSALDVYASNWFRTRGTGGWYSESYGGGWYMSDPSWIRAYANKSIYTEGEMRAMRLTSMADISAAGTITGEAVTSNGRVSAGEYLMVNGYAAINTACQQNGLIARGDDGPVFCTGGVWKRPGGPTGGAYVGRGTSTGTMSGRNDSGYTSWLYVALSGSGGNGYGAYVYVNGMMLGQIADYNRDFAKYDGTSFPVPPGGIWQVTPVNANGTRNQTTVFEYIQQ